MDVLVDDCLLYIFDFLNPLDWVSASRVCTRWNKVLTNKWKSLAEIRVVNHYINVTETNYHDLKLVLQKAGPFIASIDLRAYHFWEHAIQIGRYYYNLYDLPNIEHLIAKLSQFCTNITTITLSGSVYSLARLFQANQEIKNVNLLECGDLNKMLLKIRSMDTVEKMNVICKYKHTTCLNWCFPNVQTLYLTILANTFWQAQEAINKILVASPKLKKLRLIVFSKTFVDIEYYPCEALSHIAACTSIEEVSIIVRAVLNYNLSFEDDAIFKIISVCRNLRVVRLDHVALGDSISTDALLALPKLEELYVNVVQNFSCKFLLPLNHLTRLTLKFEEDCILDFPSLCNAIEKMPGLLHLRVCHLSEKQTLDLTCKAISCGIAQNRNIVIETQSTNGRYRFLKVTNNDLNKPIRFDETRSQILKLFISSRPDEYSDSIHKFIENSFQTFNISKHSHLLPMEYELGDRDEEEDIYFHDFLMSEDDLESSDSYYSSSSDSSSFNEDGEEDEDEDYEGEEEGED